MIKVVLRPIDEDLTLNDLCSLYEWLDMIGAKSIAFDFNECQINLTHNSAEDFIQAWTISSFIGRWPVVINCC